MSDLRIHIVKPSRYAPEPIRHTRLLTVIAGAWLALLGLAVILL